jgi:hypothetical protein
MTMKKLIQLSFLIVLATFFVAETAIAQERGNSETRPSPNASVSQTIGTTEITVTYGRPGIKGRTYFTDGSVLAPAGTVWRTGANEATTITFSDDVMFGGEEVSAGTYTLYSIPGDDWTLILNTQLERGSGGPAWGAYEYDKSKDAARVEAAVVDNDAPMEEWFLIYFDTLSDTKVHLNLHWGSTQVAVPITTGSM